MALPVKTTMEDVDTIVGYLKAKPTGATLSEAKAVIGTKPLDGRNVWPVIAEGKPSGREEMVYNVEPFRGAIRAGDWKLVWTTVLPSKLELYDLAKDAETNPAKVKQLQARIEQLARESAKPLFMEAAKTAVFGGIFGPAPIPTEDNTATAEP